MLKIYKIGFILFVCVSCTVKGNQQEFLPDKQVNLHSDDAVSEIDSIMLANGLVNPASLNGLIRYDLKYASEDNFLHTVLYVSIKKPYLQKGIAIRLGKCQEILTAIDSSLHLMIFDAVRPLSVQRKMWLALDSIPIAQRVKYVADPNHKSMHNYGAAVDLTICNSDNIPLDMGAGFDDFNPIAYPALEGKFFLNGELTMQQLANRKLLRRVMGAQGFVNIPTEWWHFDACTRKFAQLNYKVLEVEP